jgi:hypothetical protein
MLLVVTNPFALSEEAIMVGAQIAGPRFLTPGRPPVEVVVSFWISSAHLFVGPGVRFELWAGDTLGCGEVTRFVEELPPGSVGPSCGEADAQPRSARAGNGSAQSGPGREGVQPRRRRAAARSRHWPFARGRGGLERLFDADPWPAAGVAVFDEVEPELRGLVFDGDTGDVQRLVEAARREGFACRVVRGAKMRRPSGLFREFAAALQFPWFSKDTYGLSSYLDDLSGLPAGRGYLLVVTDPGDVLTRPAEPGGRPVELKEVVWALSWACEVWAGRGEAGGRWDGRGPVPFHVVLAGRGRGLTAAVTRWQRAGLRTRLLELMER